MKLCARKDILNVPAIGLEITEKTPGFVNKNHIPKGTRFEIGKADDFDKLPRDTKKLIFDLIVSESVVLDDMAHAKAIAAIDEEVKADKAKAAAGKA